MGMSSVDFPSTYGRVVRDAGEGRGYVQFVGTRIESTLLAGYIGTKVHIHDGYSEHYEISEWHEPARVCDGRRVRAGRRILTLNIQFNGERWEKRPIGGVTLLQGIQFENDGQTRESEFGYFPGLFSSDRFIEPGSDSPPAA